MYTSQILVKNIKLKAKEKNILIRDMLSACNLSINTISQISDKKGLSSFSLAKIADYLDCSVDYLLGRTDIPDLQTSTKSTNNVSNSTITGSSVVQGNNSSNFVIKNNKKSEKSFEDSSQIQHSKQADELLRIFENLDARSQVQLFSAAIDLESKFKNN